MLNAVLANNLTTLSGTAEANSSVSVFDGTNLIGTVSAAADGTWSLQANVKGNVVHSFTETSIDLAGNSASSAGVTLYAPAANKVLTGGNGDDVLIGRSQRYPHWRTRRGHVGVQSEFRQGNGQGLQRQSRRTCV